MSMLPDGVLKFAHVLPSYWYIKSNELLKTMEIFDLTNLKPILLNLGMLLLFSLIFIILNNYVTRKKRSIQRHLLLGVFFCYNWDRGDIYENGRYYV